MRNLALLVASLAMTLGSVASAQQVANQSYVCQKCGKVHVRSSPAGAPTFSTPVQQVSYNTPVASGSSMRASGGVSNVLGALNAQRSRQGIHSLRYDPQLQAVAERRAQTMASMGLKNHPPGSFSPGRYEGVGWSSSY
ncbi:MAG: CAP domain-containing protein, partial [Rubripirellula sp.]